MARVETKAFDWSFETKARPSVPLLPSRSSREFSQRIQRNITYFLGEYRDGLILAPYSYREIRESSGEKVLLAKGFEGDFLCSFRNAIEERTKKKQTTSRVLAEYHGFSRLREEIFQAETGSLFLWASPPGTGEEGADSGYSFTFIGQICPTKKPTEREILVWAFRNDLSLQEHAKVLRQLGQLVKPENLNSNGLLRLPVLIPPSQEFSSPRDLINLMARVLQETRGSATIFGEPLSQPKIERGLRGKPLKTINPLASRLTLKALLLMQFGAPENDLDNLLKEVFVSRVRNRATNFEGSFTVVRGSCGAIKFGDREGKDKEGSNVSESKEGYINCPSCGRRIKKGTDFCPYCYYRNPHSCLATGRAHRPNLTLLPSQKRLLHTLGRG